MRPLNAPPRVTASRNDAPWRAAPQPQAEPSWHDAPTYRSEPPLTRAPVVSHAPMRDPAPSRWSYRMQRIMLTPHLRRLIRFGLPALAVAAAIGIYFSSETRRAEVVQIYTDLREKFEHRPEFMVTLASVEGSSKELAEAVRARMDLNLPQSSFDLDLDAARARIEELDAVKKAELRVRSGGILQVIVTEREPVAIWRMDEGLTLVDDTGHRVAGLHARSDRPDLPVIAGHGADAATAEALEILAAAGPLAPRIRGLVRMGERRWDVILDRDQRVLLPTDAPVRALERLLALDHAQNILARDLLTVDLRLPNRPTLRLTPFALTQLRNAQGVATVESDL